MCKSQFHSAGPRDVRLVENLERRTRTAPTAAPWRPLIDYPIHNAPREAPLPDAALRGVTDDEKGDRLGNGGPTYDGFGAC